MSSQMNLTRKLVLQTEERISDGVGGYSSQWITLGIMWANIAAGTGRERTIAGGDLAQVSHQITVRSAPMTSSMRPKAGQRFLEGSRIFVIDTVSEIDAFGKYLNCATREEQLS